MRLLRILNPENATEDEVKTYQVRTAVRAVVFDKDNKVAILNVSKHGYYKLPGGGVETGENLHQALKRECLEELGCEVEITGELGEIIEYRKMFKLKQISPCFLARVVGEKGQPAFTDEEIATGFKILWLKPEEAIPLFDPSKANEAEGELYIVLRDKTFLEEATP
jgi:8-oxo-dGTP pyrophosphatase MutT (NUDIX family)